MAARDFPCVVAAVAAGCAAGVAAAATVVAAALFVSSVAPAVPAAAPAAPAPAPAPAPVWLYDVYCYASIPAISSVVGVDEHCGDAHASTLLSLAVL